MRPAVGFMKVEQEGYVMWCPWRAGIVPAFTLATRMCMHQCRIHRSIARASHQFWIAPRNHIGGNHRQHPRYVVHCRFHSFLQTKKSIPPKMEPCIAPYSAGQLRCLPIASDLSDSRLAGRWLQGKKCRMAGVVSLVVHRHSSIIAHVLSPCHYQELLRCPGVVTALRVENGYHFNCDALRRPHLHGLRSIKVKLLFQPTPAQLPHVHKKKPAERSEIPSGPGLTKKGSGSGKGAGVFSDAAELDPARDGDPASADPEPRSRPISPKGSKRELKRAGTSLAGDPAPNAAAGGETNQSPRGNHDTQHRTHHHHNHNRHHHHNHNHRSRHRMTEPKETEEDRKKKEQQERRDRKKNIRGFLSNTGCWSKRKPTKSQSKNNEQPPPGATTEMPGDDIATTVSESDDLDSHPTTGSGPLRSTRNLSWGQLFDHPATQVTAVLAPANERPTPSFLDRLDTYSFLTLKFVHRVRALLCRVLGRRFGKRSNGFCPPNA